MVSSIAQPPIPPLSDIATWSEVLEQVASSPLEFCPDFPVIARRFEAWWEHDLLDRPIFMAMTSSKPEYPITKRLDLLHQPDAWFKAKHTDMLQMYGVGDTLPHIRVDFGPVMLGGLLLVVCRSASC